MEKTPDKGRGPIRVALRAALGGLLATLVIAGLAVGWLLVDTNRSKGLIEHFVSNLTGRTFAINGEFSLALGAELRVAASDIRWAGMENGAAPWLLDVGRIVVTVPLSSLFANDIIISSATAEDARIWLEWDAAGRMNWVFFPDSPPSDEPLEALPLLLQQASLRNTELHVLHPALTEELVLIVVQADHAEDSQHRLVLDADLLLDDRPLKLKGPIGPFPELAVAGAIDFDLALTGELAALQATGGFESLAELRGPDLTATFTADDADAVLGRLRLPRITTGTIDLNTRIDTEDKGVVATAGGNLGEFQLDSSLTVHDLTSLAGFELVADSSGPSVRKLLSLAGVTGFNDIPYNLKLSARETADGLTLEQLVFETSVTRITASGSAGQFPELRNLELDLQASGDNLATVLSAFDINMNYAAPFSVTATIDSQGRETDDKVDGSIIVGESQIDFDGTLSETERLGGSQLRVRLRSPDIGRILDGFGVKLAGAVPIDITSSLALDDERLLIRESSGELGRNQFSTSGSVPLQPDGKPLDLAVRLDGPDLRDGINRLAAGAGDMLPAQQFSITTDLGYADDVLTLTNARVRAGGAEAGFGGRIDTGDTMAINGKVSVSGDNLAELMQPTGLAGFAAAPFAVGFTLATSATEIVIRDLDAKLPNGSVSGAVTASGKDYGDVKFDVRASGDNLDAALPEIAAWSPEELPFDATVRGLFADEVIDLDAADIRIGDARITASGKVVLQPDFQLESLKLDASGPRLADIGRVGDWGLKDSPFEFRAEAKRRGKRSEIKDFQFRAGNNELRGTLVVQEGPRNAVSLQLQSDNLNLDDIRTRVSGDSATGADGDSKAAAADAQVFNDEPLPFEVLKTIDADATVDIANLVAQERVFSDVSFKATLKDGALVLERGTLGTSSGRLSLNGDVKPLGSAWAVTANVTGKSLSVELDNMTAQDIALLPKFAVDGKVRLTGNTTRQLAESANGYVWVLGGEGRFRRLQVGLFAGDFATELLSKLNPFSKQSDYATLICHNYFFEVVDGVVETGPAIAIQSDIVTIVAEGNVNLVTEKLNLNFQTTPNKGIGISVTDFVNPFIKVTGTLSAPRITLDPQGSAVKGGAAVMTGGLSIFAEGLWNRWISSGKACEKITEQAVKRRRDRDPDNVPDIEAMRAGI